MGEFDDLLTHPQELLASVGLAEVVADPDSETVLDQSHEVSPSGFCQFREGRAASICCSAICSRSIRSERIGSVTVCPVVMTRLTMRTRSTGTTCVLNSTRSEWRITSWVSSTGCADVTDCSWAGTGS